MGKSRHFDDYGQGWVLPPEETAIHGMQDPRLEASASRGRMVLNYINEMSTLSRSTMQEALTEAFRRPIEGAEVALGGITRATQPSRSGLEAI